MATLNIAYGAYTAMTITNIAVASSATVGWQSDRVSNVATLALDYELFFKLVTANTAAANDKCVYVYISPAVNTTGTTYLHADQGTTTLPTGAEGATTIGVGAGNLKLLGSIAYTATQQVVQASFNLSNAVGNSMPDGFSIILINYTGAALVASGSVVAYRAITATSA